jgi:hypothetical protein
MTNLTEADCTLLPVRGFADPRHRDLGEQVKRTMSSAESCCEVRIRDSNLRGIDATEPVDGSFRMTLKDLKTAQAMVLFIRSPSHSKATKNRAAKEWFLWQPGCLVKVQDPWLSAPPSQMVWLFSDQCLVRVYMQITIILINGYILSRKYFGKTLILFNI